MTKALNRILNIKMLKVTLTLSWAKTAPLKAIQKMVTKKSKIIFTAICIEPIKSTMAAADPRQLCPIIAMVE
ncbi:MULTISPECIES: hypothetical protein [Flagellimonas]|uniref:hypothetical protein n=1 Tax=Flagellimonas TaxID=444459 RepID=UPI0018659D20|nr:hypothetical protein [Allomuricauda hadalis]